eukprot:SAG11_NODE_3955_length_2133_cov_2.017699_2_plen_110_part_00
MKYTANLVVRITACVNITAVNLAISEILYVHFIKICNTSSTKVQYYIQPVRCTSLGSILKYLGSYHFFFFVLAKFSLFQVRHTTVPQVVNLVQYCVDILVSWYLARYVG